MIGDASSIRRDRALRTSRIVARRGEFMDSSSDSLRMPTQAWAWHPAKQADHNANDGTDNFSGARVVDFTSDDPKGVHDGSHTCAPAAQ
jgi:hypothetical protein